MGDTPKAPHEQRAEQLAAQLGRRIYTYDYQGKTVVAELRRYLESEDAEKIGKPLYDFLTMVGGFIAHYSIGGFRGVYQEPTTLIEEFLAHGYSPAGRGEVGRVYRDLMTDAELYAEVRGLCTAHRESAATALTERRRAAELRALAALAERHGVELVGMPAAADDEQTALFGGAGDG